MSDQINDEAQDDVGGNETRQRILDATFKIFVEHGYKGATTRRIAQEADVNEVTIFRHFGNKLNLVEAMLDNVFDSGDIEQVIKDDLTGDIRADLHCLMEHFIGGMRKNWETINVLMYEIHRIPELTEVMHRKLHLRESHILAYFKSQVERGVLRDDIDPEIIFYSFRGATYAYGRYARSQDNPIDDVEKTVSQLIEILLNGFLK